MFQKPTQQSSSPAHRLAQECLAAGIKHAHPSEVIQRSIQYQNETLEVNDEVYDLSGVDDVIVIGGGNAAGHAAAALERTLGNRIDGGKVITDDPAPTEQIEVLPGNHPVPSERGLESTQQMLQYAENATEDDFILTIITGGGSSLMTMPAMNVEIDDLRQITKDLLQSGATIENINAVRKHLSRIKGGRLAEAASPAPVVGLVFSDVVDNDVGTIASGPTAPDDTTFADASGVLETYDVEPPHSIADRFSQGVNGQLEETPGPNAPVFDDVRNHILVTGHTAVTGAAKAAENQGINTMILSSRIRGEAREAALSHVGVIEEILTTGNPTSEPVVLVSGGETTVTVDGNGTGGPNQEFALASALEFPSDSVIASVDTDGLDGATDAAGAIVDATTVDDSDVAQTALENNDAYSYLDERDQLLKSGPTGTNVNDLRVAVIGVETEHR